MLAPGACCYYGNDNRELMVAYCTGERVATDWDYSWCECPECRRLFVGMKGVPLLSSVAERCDCLQEIQSFIALKMEKFMQLPRDKVTSAYGATDYQHWWWNKVVRALEGNLFPCTDSPRLVAAYTAARQARFEHDERGARREQGWEES